jgi:hypothetical protein
MSETDWLTPNQWIAARNEIRSILVDTARRQDVITYRALVSRLRSVRLEPNGLALARLLGDVSKSEDAVRRGMLTVVVVRQQEQMPGNGFFQLAARLGRDTSDKAKCWAEEINRVHKAWRPTAPEADGV